MLAAGGADAQVQAPGGERRQGGQEAEGVSGWKWVEGGGDVWCVVMCGVW